jgi:maleylpyruvate isomerase
MPSRSSILQKSPGRPGKLTAVSVPHHLPVLLSLVEEVTAALRTTVESLDEAALRAPTPLPNWTRAHILAHLINQADAFRRLSWGAAHNAVLEQYPGGTRQREAEIEANKDWTANQLRHELSRSADELRAAWAGMPAGAWSNPILRRELQPVWRTVQSRALEVGLHHVDLACGYTPERLPSAFVDHLLADIVSGYERRTRDTLGQRWSVARSDGGGAWTLGSGEERGSIGGTGVRLLAWLTGRADTAGLVIDGDANFAARIPQAHPYGAPSPP